MRSTTRTGIEEDAAMMRIHGDAAHEDSGDEPSTFTPVAIRPITAQGHRRLSST